jgi:2,4-dienoyl-CoA reductase-like NADH-dependent reductase (Old Yellow Enzyme family)/thioredoxin reductase
MIIDERLKIFMNTYPLIRQPAEIGTLTLKNRLIMAPMGTMYSDEGFVTDKLVNYYVERAKGGVALIVTEHTGISSDGRGSKDMLMLSEDAHIPGIIRLTKAIQDAGAMHALELNFAGRTVIPADVREGQMNIIANDWATSAIRAKKCGVNGVIVHMSNGYLLHRFLSSVFNERTDQYGGCAANRARFPEMVLKRVRAAVGDSYPVWVRMSLVEDIEGGFTVDDAIVTAQIMEKAGADALDLSAGGQTSVYRVHPTYYKEDALNMTEGKIVKEKVGIPTICGGKVRNLETAEKALQGRCCDMVFMGRALLADPYLIQKSFAGNLNNITPCLSCNNCNKTSRTGCMHCAVNPYAGHEGEVMKEKTSKPKKVLVIGGGVAGILSSEVCTKVGHRVTLVEKRDKLGGHALNAATLPRKERIFNFIEHLVKRAVDSGVEIHVNTEISVDNIDQMKADIIVLATGATPRIPTFLPGLETMKNLVTFEDVLQSDKSTNIGDKVLVLGGGEVGAEMADYLTEYGKSVAIIEMTDAIMSDATPHIQHDLGNRLQEKGVEVFLNTKVAEFDHDIVVVETAEGEKKRMDGFDNVVLAMGLVSTTPTMMDIIEGKAEKVIVIGDSNQPRGIAQAMEDALFVPNQIEKYIRANL